MNKILLFGLCILSFFVLMGIGHAACTAPAVGNIGASTEYCNVRSQLNATQANSNTDATMAVLNITANNIKINCSNATFTGNGTFAFAVTQFNNVTVQGCNITNYRYGIETDGSNTAPIIIDNYFSNILSGGIYYASSSGIMRNNTLSNATIYMLGGTNNNISNNDCTLPILPNTGVQYPGRSECMLISGRSNNIFLNTFRGGWRGVYFSGNGSRANNFTLNNITQSDVGMRIFGVNPNSTEQLLINYNFFDNNTNNFDFYQQHIELINSTNINISNNVFNRSVDVPIDIQVGNNIIFNNNTLDMICSINRSQFTGSAQNEPCVAIKIGQVYKTWNYFNCTGGTYNISCVSSTISNNITVNSNTFTGDVVSYFFLQGVTNFNTNLPSANYWYRKISFRNITTDNEYYISNNITSLYSGNRQFNLTSLANNFYEGWQVNPLISYGINRTHVILYGINDSTTQIVSIFNGSGTNDEFYSRDNASYIDANTNGKNETVNIGKSYFYLDGGCDFAPTENSMNVISTNINVCNGTYRNATFNITASNLRLNFNWLGTYFSGCYLPGLSQGCFVDNYVNRNNVTVGNLNATGNNTVPGIWSDRGNNFTVENVTLLNWSVGLSSNGNSATNPQPTVIVRNANISNSGGCLANLWTIGGIWFINDSIFNNALNISGVGCSQGPHGLYFSDSTGQRINTVTLNNVTANSNTLNSGLHFNVASHNYSTGHVVNNSRFNGNNIGMILDSINNSAFENINASNDITTGVAIGYGDIGAAYGSTNITLRNVSFTGSGDRDIFYTAASNNFIYDSVWSNPAPASGNIRFNAGNFSLTIVDNNSGPLVAKWHSSASYSQNASVNFTYTGYKNVLFQNNTVTFTNMRRASQNNDIKNVSFNSILAYNIDNYSITLDSNQQLQVGDFSNLTSIDFSSPSESNNSVVNRYFLMFNVSVNGSGFSNMTSYLWLNGSVFASNFSSVNQSFVNFTSLADGIWAFNVTAFDGANVAYYSATRFVTISTLNPIVTVYSPTAITYTTRNFSINFTATDVNGIDSLWFNNGTTNITYTTPINITNLTDGSYVWYFYSNDTLGNIGSTSVSFSVLTNGITCTSNSGVSLAIGTAVAILIIVFLLYIYMTFIGANIAGLTASIITIVVVARFIPFIVNSLLGVC